MSNSEIDSSLSCAPGEGERRAQRGYTRQYHEAGAAIYAGLVQGDLEWVGLADRGAGIADDVVLGFPGRAVGHQFKTSRFPDPFRLRTLLLGADGLLLPLIKAWQALIRSNPGRVVELCLVTNDYPSKTDKLIDAEGTHSASFLLEFDAHPARALAEWRTTAWQPWIDEICSAGQIDEQAFDLFLRSLRIIHGSAADFVQMNRLTPEGARLASEIATRLPLLVADVRDRDRWTRAELLNELGWRDSAIARHIHQFPVGVYVQRNVATERELRQAIRNSISGYVSLVGPPGAGKSTLLQAALEAEEGMLLVRYLAYVPGVGQGVGRGEAEHFYDDLNAHLKGTGLIGLQFHDESLHERRMQFSALIKQAGERFERDGIRTLIVIDGLDHVPREERPQHSFLAELPLPQAIPPGVLFVLGTQRLDLADIKPAVQDQAGETERNIVVQPLMREAVHRIADILGLDSTIDRDRVFELSKGHPLVTRYLIEALRGANADTREELLAGAMQFEGDIEAVYNSAWRSIRDDDQAREVLDYLARVEGAMPLELLAQAVPEQAIERALRATRHLLNDGLQGWTVFHNSFRLFILDQPKMRLGRPDTGYTKRVYQALAALALVAAPESEQRWLELRYRARAEEHAAVLALATPQRFRKQLVESRSFEELRADLRLVFASVRHHYDPTKLFHLMLIQDEVGRRWEAYEDARSLVEALLHVGDVEAAITFVEQIPDKGYEVVDALIRAGDMLRARTLFDRLEPLQQLLSGASSSDQLEVAELEDWARRVIHFRGVDQILQAINRLSSAARLPWMDAGRQEVDSLAAHLRSEVALAVMTAQLDTESTELSQTYGVEAAELVSLQIRAGLVAAEVGQSTRAMALIREAYAQEAFLEAPNGLRRAAALSAAKHGDLSLATDIHHGLMTPALAELDHLTGDDESEHMARAVLEHAELTAMLGQTSTEVPDSKRTVLRPLQFHTTTVGALLGSARRDRDRVSDGEVAQAARAALTYLDCARPSDSDGFYAMHQIVAATPVLGKALIQAAAICGEQEFVSTVTAFDDAFAQPNSTNSGRMNLRRVVAVQIYRLTGDVEGASRRLEPLVQSLIEATPAQQIDGLAELATSFAQVGNVTRAKELLKRIPQESLGYSRPPKKDPQYAIWSGLLEQANQVQPDKRRERVALLLRQVSGMVETEGRSAAYRIAPTLLEQAAQVDATYGWWAGCRLVELGLMGWAHLLDSLLIGLIKRRPDMILVATVTWCELALPYYMEPHYSESRLGEFIAVVIEVASAVEVALVIDTIQAAIEAEARAQERVGLLERLRMAANSRGHSTVAIDDAKTRWGAEAPPPRHSSAPRRYDHIPTLEQLQELLEKDSLTSEIGYEAARAFNRLASQADFALVKRMFDQWKAFQKDSRTRLVIIELAVASGEMDLARHLADGYLEETEDPVTWSSWSGGRLQRHFRAKLKIYGTEVHAAAYDNFVGGMAVGRESIPSTLLEYDDIFPILTESPDWPAMWDCLAEQLVTTREYAIGTDFNVVGRDSISDDQQIASLFAQAFELSLAELHRHAVCAALRLRTVRGGEAVFALIVQQLLNGQADLPAEGIQLLLLEGDDSLASQLADQVVQLTQHADYAISESAIVLARRWGLSPGRKIEPLSPYYSLVLEDESEFFRPQLVDAISGAMRVEDVLGWTFAFKGLIELLALSGISVTQIRHRCRIFIDQWGGLDVYGNEATRRLESELRKFEMKMPYGRPHIAVAARALRFVAGELRRGEVLPDEATDQLLYMMSYPAPQAPLISPVARPVFIRRPSLEGMRWHSEDQGWLDGIEDDTARLLPGGDAILAEVCEFHIRRSRRTFSMQRIRGHALDINNALHDIDAYKLFPRATWIDGPYPLSSQPARTIVRRLSTIWKPEIPEFRLTICPFWLQRLNWHPHPSNDQVYVDKSGLLVAQIVWWRDGGPVDLDDEVIWGEGMYVSLTPGGRAQLELFNGPLQVDVYVRRNCEQESKTEDVSFRIFTSRD